MATALDIVSGALRLIKVVAVDEDPSAAYASHALEALNDMIFAWELRGVDVSHIALALSDTFALAEKYHEAVKYLLGQRLANVYNVPPPDAIITDDGWRRLQAAFWTDPTSSVDAGLIDMPSQYSYGNTRETSA